MDSYISHCSIRLFSSLASCDITTVEAEGAQEVKMNEGGIPSGSLQADAEGQFFYGCILGRMNDS